ncbi:MAG TPA: carboxypeptidase regulatory-like domain-containing protein [Thermoanaerobaculia bacterium]|nr:carboxypeptidase regulatory-like domain-containing protein [Thermoanaerobaculia bacterium]
MLRSRQALPALLLALLSSLASFGEAAAPLRITGRILHPPKDAQVELRPWSVGYEEALRRLKGETVPPIASARPLPDGSFALKVPETGFYSVLVRAEGHVALESFVSFLVEETEVPPVELRPAALLEIRAVGADGQPLAGVVLQAIPQKEPDEHWRAADRRAVTDAEGKAVFPRSDGEMLTLVVTTPGLYATASTTPSGASQTVRFPAPRFRTIEIRGANGKPAAGALVRLARRGWPFGLTGQDGRIALPVPQKDEIGVFAEDSKGLRIEIVMTTEAGEGTDVPVVALRSPTTVTGRVLDAARRDPVPGALVWNGGTAWARTDASGSFELRAPSGDRGTVEASTAGSLRHVHRWKRDENVPITFLLGPGAAITGQVVDEAGNPIEGAKVATNTNPLDPRSIRMEERKAWTGPDGRFVLRQLPAGRLHNVAAVREGFAPAQQLADSTAPIRLVLRRGTAATGRVVTGEGLPVAGAELTLMPAESEPVPGPWVSFQAVSDAGGRFRLQNLKAGRFSLRAVRAGFAPAVVQGIEIPETPETPETAPQLDLGDVTLQPGAAIEGIVTDTRGRPVEKASVSLGHDPSGFLTPELSSMSMEPVETGPDGRFRFADLPRGSRFEVNAGHPELAHEVMSGVEAPTAKPVHIRLARSRSLEGRVVDAEGEPVAGARVFPSYTSAGFFGAPLGGRPPKTDEEGRFVLSRLKPGTIDVLVSASGYKTRREPGVLIPEEGEIAPVEITLQPGTSLEGRVLDREDLPLRYASVHLQGEDQGFFRMAVSTDEEGHYEIGDLEPGSYEVRASAGQGPSVVSPVQIRPGRNRLDLRLAAGAEVSGRVISGSGGSDGKGIAGAGVSLVPQKSTPVQGLHALEGFRVLSSADGSFVIEDVPDGEYTLSAARQGFAGSVLPEVRVEGAPVGGLELRLGPGAVIRGRLLGLSPDEARKAMISAYSQGSDLHQQGLVEGAEGEDSYRISDVAPGDWTVSVHLSANPAVQGTVRVEPGDEEVVLDLEVSSGFTLTGRVLLDRVPLAGAFINLQSSESHHGGRATAHDGSFILERVPAGTYTLMIFLPSGVSHTQTVDVTGDREIAVEILTGGVEGRVLSPEGLPVAGALVSMTSEGPEGMALPGPSTTSDNQGAFELPRVSTGTYTMTVQSEGFAPAESRVVVTPGGTVHVDLALAPAPKNLPQQGEPK